jgi:HD-GYP domain-containing protein (c-di-GMP phosphodiesterase class II)
MLSQQENYMAVDSSNLAKKGQDILVRLTSSMKTAQIYELNNLTLIKQVNILFMFIQDALQNESEAKLQLRENTLFFNSVRIKYDFATYESFKFLAAEFKKREIGVMSFDPGLIEDELKAFIVFFANTPEAEDHPFEVFQKQLETQKMDHVFLEKLHPFERLSDLEEKDAKKLAQKVFFKSITHLREVFEREKEQKRVHLKTTRRLMQSIVNLIIQDETFMVGLSNIKNYDEYTLNHSINVCVLSMCLGRRLGLDKHELMELGIASFFHDIGKLEIPKEILDKPGRLTKQEREIIERHPHLGAEILVRLKEFSYLPVRALYVALEHHLRLDLSGYPKVWKKNSINLYSQIVEICDFFDAVTTDRPYRKRTFTRYEALSMMLEKSGEEFNPHLLKIFTNMVGVYPIGSLVALDTGEIGIVSEVHSDVSSLLQPKVKLITDSQGNKIDGETVDLRIPQSEKTGSTRKIIKALNPQKYNIRISDYFVAEVEQPAAAN